MNYIDVSKEMLNEWIYYSMQDLYQCPDRPDLMCYGAGYNGWGMQTHQKALAAFAIAATDDSIKTTIDKKTLLDISKKMLRYMLESHIEGNYHCLEGESWGHTWISVLGTERAMHAIEELIPYLDDSDKKLLRKVFISEADWLLNCYDVVADKEDKTGRNKPESNIWNGAFLHRTASLYPDCENTTKYIEKAGAFFVNSISIDGDRNSEITYDGQKVQDLYVGSNFFDSYSLDHHGYLNVGYMVICLSNIAMYHFSCKKLGFKAPASLYHHAEELWRLIKSNMFPDGRLIRIGGDTRVRYCYCQDYALPMLDFVRDYIGDRDAVEMEEGIVNLFKQEFDANNDGSFLSDRCSGFKEVSPIYYTRLESDKAAVLSMLINWNKYIGKSEETISLHKTWKEDFHGACFVRDENRFSSWTWKGATSAVGLCLPLDRSDFAEWDDNLAGEIKGMGATNTSSFITGTQDIYEGGFVACGYCHHLSQSFLAEQQKDELSAVKHVCFAALPDGATTVVMHYAYSPQRIYLKTVKGLNLNIPNDLFNNFTREYCFGNQSVKLNGLSETENTIDTHSKFIHVDNIIGMHVAYGNDAFKIYQPKGRNVAIRKSIGKDNYYNDATANLCADTICATCKTKPFWADKGEILLDEAAVVSVNITKERTKKKSEFVSNITVTAGGLTRYVITLGENDRVYAVVANFGTSDEKVSFSKSAKDLYTQKTSEAFVISAKTARVFEIND